MKDDAIKALTREEIFEKLEEMGVVQVHVPYHGANDESYLEEAELYREKVDLGSLMEPAFTLRTEGWTQIEPGGELKPVLPDDFGYELARPIEEELGQAFGDSVPGVEGTLVWRVPERTVTLYDSFLEWTDEVKEV